jgi:hypothetical protein
MAKTRSDVQSRPRRRWIIIGPGILIAIILALQVAIKQHTVSSRPPIIERQVIGRQGTSELARSVGYVIDHAEQLKLSERQLASLKNLEGEWETRSAPLQSELNRAASEFERFMKQAEGKVTAQEIQARGAEVSELSRQMASLRRVYWQKALQMLDEEQRKTILEESRKIQRNVPLTNRKRVAA